MDLTDVTPAHPDGTGPAESNGAQPDDPLPDARAWRRQAEPRLEHRDIARLQATARQSRARIAQRLTGAGLVPGAGATAASAPDIDARRDLDAALELDVDTLQRIDELHDRRMRSASPRERQHATTVLAEALHRIVDGYQVRDPPPSRVVRGLRRADDGVRRAYARLTVFDDHTPVVAWWEPVSRWVLLVLAAISAVLLAGGHVVGAAAVVAMRVMLAALTAPPAPSASTWRRLIGYNPDWASSVCSHAGGRPLWAALTMGAALFGLMATVSRIAAREQGLRLPRLWLERAAKDLALTGAVVAAAITTSRGLGSASPLTLTAPAVVAAMGVIELIRTAYYARRRRHLLSRAATASGSGDLVPNAIVVSTGDAIVVNLRRSGLTSADLPGPSRRGWTAPAGDPRRRLRLISAKGPLGPTRARPGRAGRPTRSPRRPRASAAPGRVPGHARSRCRGSRSPSCPPSWPAPRPPPLARVDRGCWSARRGAAGCGPRARGRGSPAAPSARR